MKTLIMMTILVLLATLPARAVDDYQLDDGTGDQLVGPPSAGVLAWIQHFNPIGRPKTITHVSTIFGLPSQPNLTVPAGTPVTVYLWDDPDNLGNLHDAVLLAQGSGTVQDVDTGTFVHIPLDTTVTVYKNFFVGVAVEHDTEHYSAPLDNDTTSLGRAWYVSVPPGSFDPVDLTNNNPAPFTMDTTPWPHVWMLRADALPLAGDCDSFDNPDATAVLGWDQWWGNWDISGKRLHSENYPDDKFITFGDTDLADGCITARSIHPGMTTGPTSSGLVARFDSPTTNIRGFLSDGTSMGSWDSIHIYEDHSTLVSSLTGLSLGNDADIQFEFNGTAVTFRVDSDRDGSWDVEHSATVTTTAAGSVGVYAFARSYIDDFCYGQACDTHDGTVVDFDSVPQTYWEYGGSQNLGGYYPGLTFGPRATILEDTVIGYPSSFFPYHSADAVLTSYNDDHIRVDFDTPADRAAFWYTSGLGELRLEAYDAGNNPVAIALSQENGARNDYLQINGNGTGMQYLLIKGQIQYFTIDDFQYRSVPATLSASFSCLPASGTLPFATIMTATLNNLYTGQTRRLAARVDVTLANDSEFSNWRSGYTNVAPGGSFVSAWDQGFPALGSLLGDNQFLLTAYDVTPSPYNQPPHPAAGDTATVVCTVTGVAP